MHAAFKGSPMEKETTSQKRIRTAARLAGWAALLLGRYRLSKTELATIMAPNKKPQLTSLARVPRDVMSARIATNQLSD